MHLQSLNIDLYPFYENYILPRGVWSRGADAQEEHSGYASVLPVFFSLLTLQEGRRNENSETKRIFVNNLIIATILLRLT